jgi:hypothetical protein
MLIIIPNLLKGLLGMKLGTILLMVAGAGGLLFILKTFVFGKVGGVASWFIGWQGKLVYYFLVVSLITALSLGLYHKITDATYENNYNNIVKRANQIIIDQRQILPPEDELIAGINIFGFKFGLTHHSKATPPPLVIPPIPKEPLSIPLSVNIGIILLSNLIIGVALYIRFRTKKAIYKNKELKNIKVPNHEEGD